jgi:hypothetical protein
MRKFFFCIFKNTTFQKPVSFLLDINTVSCYYKAGRKKKLLMEYRKEDTTMVQINKDPELTVASLHLKRLGKARRLLSMTLGDGTNITIGNFHSALNQRTFCAAVRQATGVTMALRTLPQWDRLTVALLRELHYGGE